MAYRGLISGADPLHAIATLLRVYCHTPSIQPASPAARQPPRDGDTRLAQCSWNTTSVRQITSFQETHSAFLFGKGACSLGASGPSSPVLTCRKSFACINSDRCGEEVLFMRSELVFGAVPAITNRYQLCGLVAKATRKLHKPHARMQDTVNEVLTRLGSVDAVVSQGCAEPAHEFVESSRAA
jgi:hypothetical protein